MAYFVNPDLIEAQFWQTMQECGIRPKHGYGGFYVQMDGTLYRFPVEGDKSGEKSGAYFCYADGWPNWGFMDYHVHDEMQKFSFNGRDVLPPDEYEALKKTIPEEKREEFRRSHSVGERKEYDKEAWKKQQGDAVREKERIDAENEAYRARVHEREQRLLRELYDGGLGDVSHHPYLAERFTDFRIAENLASPFWLPEPLWGFWGNDMGGDYSAEGKKYILRIAHCIPAGFSRMVERGDLLVPISDALTRDFLGVQRIRHKRGEDGKYQKGFCTGTHPSGGCFEILPDDYGRADKVYLVEGLATGIAVSILTHGLFPVFCALSCGNLRAVAERLRERIAKQKMKREIWLMADNDCKMQGKRDRNPGIDAAEAVKKLGLIDQVRVAAIGSREAENIDWYDVAVARKLAGMV